MVKLKLDDNTFRELEDSIMICFISDFIPEMCYGRDKRKSTPARSKCSPENYCVVYFLNRTNYSVFKC